jgi:phage terminase Nu1 subunit (DNA packaging protein)
MSEHLLSRKQMADACQISTQAFDKWEVQPVRKVGRMMMYSVADVIENRIEKQVRKNDNRANFEGEVINIDDERAMLTRQQRITQEIKNEILEGRAIPVEAARDVLAKILGRIGATLDSLAPNIKRRHPEIEQRIIDFIKSEIIKHQNEASNLDDHLDDIIDEVVSEAEAKV